MKRPSTPPNPIYQTGGDTFGLSNTSTTSVNAIRRPMSALAGGLPSSHSRLQPTSSGGASEDLLGTSDLKAKHLSLSRRLIELWGMLEIPAQRRQESIGSSMVIIVPSPQHIAIIRKLVDELEAYSMERQRASKLLLSSVNSAINSEPYRPHPTDNIPIEQRRPVSAAFVRPTSATLLRSSWSRPTSALATRKALPVVGGLAAAAADAAATTSTGNKVNVSLQSPVSPIRVDGLTSPPQYRTKPQAWSVIDTSDASISNNVSVVDDSNGFDVALSSSKLAEELRKRVQSAADPNATNELSLLSQGQSIVGEHTREHLGRADMVDAGTMTIESYLCQDSAIVKRLFADEAARRHEVEEMYARPVSKLFLLHLTRLSDLEERLLRGISSPKKGAVDKDAELFSAMGINDDKSKKASSSPYSPSPMLVNKLVMDEAVERVFFTERAEKISDIEFSLLVTRMEEESRRAHLCGVLEPESWERVLRFITHSLSTELCDCQWLITDAYLERYDLEREEHFAREALQSQILRSKKVFSATGDSTALEAKGRRIIDLDETVTFAVITSRFKEEGLPLWKAHCAAQRLALAATEQCSRQETQDAFLGILNGHFDKFRSQLSNATSLVNEYEEHAAVSSVPQGSATNTVLASQEVSPPPQADAAVAAVENNVLTTQDHSNNDVQQHQQEEDTIPTTTDLCVSQSQNNVIAAAPAPVAIVDDATGSNQASVQVTHEEEQQRAEENTTIPTATELCVSESQNNVIAAAPAPISLVDDATSSPSSEEATHGKEELVSAACVAPESDDVAPAASTPS